MRNYIYLDKGYHKGFSEKTYQVIKKNNGLIVSLDEEGAIDYKNNTTLLNVRYPKEMLNSVDYTFLWGKYQFNLLDENIKHKKKLYVTGHPRFTLLKQPYHHLYENEVNNIKAKFGKFVLVNTNMGKGNNIRGHKFIIDNYGKKYSDIEAIAKYNKDKVKHFISLIKEISNKLNKRIVVRPHPEEASHTYSRAFKDDKNISVIFEGLVIPWILASEVMIHADCTTAIESVFLGKKPISFIPNHNPAYVSPVPVKVSSQFDCKNKVVEYIRNMPDKADLITKDDITYLENYFSHSKNSIKAVTERLNAIRLAADFRYHSRLSFSDLFKLYLKSLKLSSDYILDRNRLSKNKLNTFNDAEVRKMCHLFNQTNTEFRKNKVTKIVEKLYLFERDNNFK
tara:strand:+ start:7507 stop:8691 length:1185 start_codon:yes stop_codon:yes gene_type:complete